MLFCTSSTVSLQLRLYLNTMKVGNKRGGRIVNNEGEKFESAIWLRKRMKRENYRNLIVLGK